MFPSSQQPNQNYLPSALTCQSQQLPIDTIFRLDDPYCSKSGYIEIHQLNFEMPPLDYGTQQLRQHYNITKQLKKYFAKRYFYFSLFQSGIQLDAQSWYSVLAQPISLYLIQRLKYCGVQSVFQPFSGVGGFAVHAAGQFKQLVANDLDGAKIKKLKNNLSVYGKGLNLLKVYNTDYAKIQPFQVDVVVICPPWGGSDISLYQYQDLDQLMTPRLSDVLTHCKKFSKNLVLQMPKNTNLTNLLKIINLCFLNPIIKIQKVNVDGRVSQIFVYIGNLHFTQVNPQVLNNIMQQSNKNGTLGKNMENWKLVKKNLRKKIQKQQNYDIFNQIYQNQNNNQNKHIFFN